MRLFTAVAVCALTVIPLCALLGSFTAVITTKEIFGLRRASADGKLALMSVVHFLSP